ncbi:hypothetical protein [Sphingomonas oryzagri]
MQQDRATVDGARILAAASAGLAGRWRLRIDDALSWGRRLNILCLIAGHKINRAKVWHDGLDHRSRCARCDATLVRDPQVGRWRVFDPKKDDDRGRIKKPGH